MKYPIAFRQSTYDSRHPDRYWYRLYKDENHVIDYIIDDGTGDIVKLITGETTHHGSSWLAWYPVLQITEQQFWSNLL
jgi:hypothetical protein